MSVSCVNNCGPLTLISNNCETENNIHRKLKVYFRLQVNINSKCAYHLMVICSQAFNKNIVVFRIILS